MMNKKICILLAIIMLLLSSCKAEPEIMGDQTYSTFSVKSLDELKSKHQEVLPIVVEEDGDVWDLSHAERIFGHLSDIYIPVSLWFETYQLERIEFSVHDRRQTYQIRYYFAEDYLDPETNEVKKLTYLICFAPDYGRSFKNFVYYKSGSVPDKDYFHYFGNLYFEIDSELGLGWIRGTEDVQFCGYQKMPLM